MESADVAALAEAANEADADRPEYLRRPYDLQYCAHLCIVSLICGKSEDTDSEIKS